MLPRYANIEDAHSRMIVPWYIPLVTSAVCRFVLSDFLLQAIGCVATHPTNPGDHPFTAAEHFTLSCIHFLVLTILYKLTTQNQQE